MCDAVFQLFFQLFQDSEEVFFLARPELHDRLSILGLEFETGGNSRPLENGEDVEWER